MEIPRSLPDRLTEELNALSDAGRHMVANALARLEWSDVAELRSAMAEVMEAVCSELSDLAAARSAEFYDDVRAASVGSRFGALAESGRDPSATDGAVRALVQSVVDTGSTERFARELGDRVDYEVKKSAGDCIVANASSDPLRPRYARVPSGAETCPFCIMLASRGFVYRTDRSAGSVNHYHPNCDCRVVPGFDGMTVEGYDPDDYYEQWKHPEIHTPNRDFSNVEYGEYRGVSYIGDRLGDHRGDGSDLDPVKMVIEDTGFTKDRAKQVLDDMHRWTGEGYTGIRRREGRYSEIADRIEEFIASSPKYRGAVYRGIGVERNVADGIVSALLEGEEIDQLGISSWATGAEWAQEFGSMNLERCEDGVKIIFRLAENKTGVSIKHVATAADNDEVIASENMRYILDGNIEQAHDPYDGDYLLIPVKEA